MQWQDFISSPDFQKGDDAQREKLRQQYFYDVVAPNLSQENYYQVRDEFDRRTKPRGNPNQGLFGDTVDAVQQGLYNAGADMVGGVDYLTGIGGDAEQYLREHADSQLDEMAPSSVRAMQDFGLEDDPDGGYQWREGSNARGLWLNIASGVGSTAPMLAGGGLIGAGLKGVGRVASGAGKAKAALKAGNATQEMAEKAAKLNRITDKVGSGFGHATAGGLLMGGGGVNEVEQELNAATYDDLKGSELFQSHYRNAYNENPNAGTQVAFEEAKRRLMEDAKQTAFAGAAVPGALSMGVLGPALSKVVRGTGPGKTVGGKISAGGAIEGAQEFIEEGSQGLAVNAAMQPIDDRSLTEGVGARALTGALIGAGSGSGMATPVAIYNRNQPELTAQHYADQIANLEQKIGALDIQLQQPDADKAGLQGTRGEMLYQIAELQHLKQQAEATPLNPDPAINNALAAQYNEIKPQPLYRTSQVDLGQTWQQTGQQVNPEQAQTQQQTEHQWSQLTPPKVEPRPPKALTHNPSAFQLGHDEAQYQRDGTFGESTVSSEQEQAVRRQHDGYAGDPVVDAENYARRVGDLKGVLRKHKWSPDKASAEQQSRYQRLKSIVDAQVEFERIAKRQAEQAAQAQAKSQIEGELNQTRRKRSQAEREAMKAIGMKSRANIKSLNDLMGQVRNNKFNENWDNQMAAVMADTQSQADQLIANEAALDPQNIPVPEQLSAEAQGLMRDSFIRTNLLGTVMQIEAQPLVGRAIGGRDGVVQGRIKSTNPDWYKNLPADAKLKAKEAHNTVHKALAGKPLGKRQANFIEAALGELQQELDRLSPEDMAAITAPATNEQIGTAGQDSFSHINTGVDLNVPSFAEAIKNAKAVGVKSEVIDQIAEWSISIQEALDSLNQAIKDASNGSAARVENPVSENFSRGLQDNTAAGERNGISQEAGEVESQLSNSEAGRFAGGNSERESHTAEVEVNKGSNDSQIGKKQPPNPTQTNPANERDFSLDGQSQTEVNQQEADRQAQEQAEQKAKQDTENKAKADRQRNDFDLTGSDRQADANPNQTDLMDTAQVEPETATNSVVEPEKKTSRKKMKSLFADSDADNSTDSTDSTDNDKAQEAPQDKPKTEAKPKATRQSSKASQEQIDATGDRGDELSANKRQATRINWDDIKDLNSAAKVKATSKTAIWSRPNYEQLIDEGMESIDARILKQVYDGIVPKSEDTSDEGLKLYIEAVSEVRDTINNIIEDGEKQGQPAPLLALFPNAFEMAATPNSGSISIIDALEQQKKVTSESSVLLDRFFPEPEEGGNRFISPEKRAKATALGGNKFVKAIQITVADARKQLKQLADGWPAKKEAWQRSYKIEADKEGQYKLYKKRNGRWWGTSEPVFKTEAQAIEHAKTLVQRKAQKEFKEPETNVTTIPPLGSDHRKGRDISTDELKDTFKFRGVNFGNWMKGKSKDAVTERQMHLNYAYESFMDLAGLLGVPPKALSLGGQIGIAFGAQGRKGAAAHFVPGYNEINLTRNHGAGTLAHEWGHALDHYFAVQAKHDRTDNPFMTDAVSRFNADEVLAKGDVRPEIAEAFKTLVNVFSKQETTLTEGEIRKEIERINKQRIERRKSAEYRDDQILNELRNNIEKYSFVMERKENLKEFDRLRKVIESGNAKNHTFRRRSRTFGWTNEVEEISQLVKKATRKFPAKEKLNGLGSVFTESHQKTMAEMDAKAIERLHIPQTKRTNFKAGASNLDSGRKKPYWSTKLEMFARAFESYVHDRLTNKNAYLTAAWKSELSGVDEIDEHNLNAYPQGDERETINKAFDTLINEIKVKDEDSDRPLLYSLNNDSVANISRAKAMLATGPLRRELSVPVKVVQSESDLPADILDELHSDNAEGRVRGLYHTDSDTAYLVADNLATTGEANRILLHEVVGHGGLRRVLGKKLNLTLDQISRSMPDKVESKLRASYASQLEGFTDKEQARLIAEEYIAHLAETDPKNKVLEGVVSRFRNWLRRFIPSIEWTRNDVVQLLAESKRKVTMPGPEGGPDDSGTNPKQNRYSLAATGVLNDLADNGLGSEVLEDMKKTQYTVAKAAKSWPERIGEWLKNLDIREAAVRDNLWSRFYTGAIDSFDAIARLEKRVSNGELLEGARSAYKAALRTKNLDGIMTAILGKGTPKLVNGSVEFREGSKGFLEIMEPVASKGELELWEHWAAAQRAKRLLEEDQAIRAQGEVDLQTAKDAINEMRGASPENYPGGLTSYKRDLRHYEKQRDDAKARSKQSRENLYNRAMIERIERYVASDPERLARFRQAKSEWNDFNKSILDFAQDAGLIDPDARSLWEHDDYIPFHRISDLRDEQDETPFGRGLSGAKSGIQQLKGGVEHISPIEAMYRNTRALVNASMRNIAMQRIAELGEPAGVMERSGAGIKLSRDEVIQRLGELDIDNQNLTDTQIEKWSGLLAKFQETGEGTVSLSKNGKSVVYQVHDPMLLAAMGSVGPDLLQGWLKVLAIPKRFLTQMITADPAFMAANLVRDTLSTWMTVHPKIGDETLRVNPLMAAMRTIHKSVKSDSHWQLMMAGGGSGGFYDISPDNVRRKLTGADKRRVLDSPRKMWEAWQTFGSRFENANRLAVYDGVIKAGGSVAEAAHQAQDVLNFSRRGRWALIRAVTEVVPFMNARIQGLDRLGRGLKENKAAFVLRGTIYAGVSMALLAAFGDEEEYIELPDWEKRTYHHLWIDGEHWRIPKPFEVGSIFGTIPELAYNMMQNGEDAHWVGKMAAGIFLDTFAMDPTPQAIKPVLEVAMNENSFTGSPILGLGMKYLKPEAQYNPWTSETMKALAEVMPDFAPEWARSPKRLQHLVQGYTGTLGRYVLMASDSLARDLRDAPVRPEARMQDIPVVGRFYRDGENSTRYGTEMYEFLSEANTLASTIKAYSENGMVEEANELAEGKDEMLASRKPVQRMQRKISKLRGDIRTIMENKYMLASAKRRRIDQLQKQINELAAEAANIL